MPTNNNTLNNPNLENKGFNIKDFIKRHLKYLPLVILGLILGYIGAKIKLRYSVEKYQANGTILIKSDKQNGGDKGKDIEALFTSKSDNDLNTVKELMKSRYLMKRVIKTLGITNKYYVVGKVKSTQLYQNNPIELSSLQRVDTTKDFILNKLTVLDINNFEINGKKYSFNEIINANGNIFKIVKSNLNDSSNIGYSYKIFSTDLNSEAANLVSQIKINPIGEFTRLLGISCVTENPKLSSDIVNTLMNEYIEQNKEDNNTVSKFTKKFIDDRVSSLEGELKGIETSYKDFREKNGAINLDAQSQVYLGNINIARSELSKQIVVLGVAQSLLENFKKDVDAKGYAPTGTISDPSMQNMFLSFNELQLKLKQMRSYVTESEINFIEKENDLKRLRNAIIEGLEKLISNAELSASGFEKTIKENGEKLDKIPYLQKEILNYNRDQKIKEELYLFLKKRGEEEGISAVSNISNAKIIDEAIIDKTAVEPISKIITGLGLFLGLIIPLMFIYLIELFDNKVRSREDVIKNTSVPILSDISHSKESNTLIVTAKSRKVIVEQFRILRSNIQFQVGEKQKITILVTSSFSGEGKSFISTNIAAAHSLTGKKTVLLEFDLRKPKVIEGLKLGKSVGISNYVVGKSSVTEIIRPVPNYENFFVVGCGAIPPNPSELLLEDKINSLFTYLQENFDIIVIDSAPIGLVTDSMALGKYADTTLYVIRDRYTYKKQLKLVNDYYIENKLPKMGLIINDIKGNKGSNYGYGSYSNKKYGYGNGYFDEEDKNILIRIFQKIKSFLIFWK